MNALKGADMVFIAGGMGGGTGTGASPVIARIAKEQGILVVAVVTKPFFFEGQQRMRLAEKGLDELEKEVDALIVIPNDRIFSVVDKNTIDCIYGGFGVSKRFYSLPIIPPTFVPVFRYVIGCGVLAYLFCG